MPGIILGNKGGEEEMVTMGEDSYELMMMGKELEVESFFGGSGASWLAGQAFSSPLHLDLNLTATSGGP